LQNIGDNILIDGASPGWLSVRDSKDMVKMTFDAQSLLVLSL
jgi:hypothetical protein